MLKMNNEFTKGVVKAIVDEMEEAEDDHYESLHELFDACFDGGLYIPDYYHAAKALNAFKSINSYDGAFGAISVVKDYELNHNGEVVTDLTDASDVADALATIIGKEAFKQVEKEIGLGYDDKFDDKTWSKVETTFKNL